MSNKRYYFLSSEWGKMRDKLTKEEFEKWRKEKNNKHRRELYQRNKQIIDAHKGSRSCQCGESNILCLEFHHRDQLDKLFNISLGGKKTSITRLEHEIEKCDIICKNCHTKIHNKTTQNIHILKKKIEEINLLLLGKLDKPERHKLHRNKQKYIAKLYIKDHKIKNNCEKCGENNSNCLVFHHNHKTNKEAKIPQLYKYGIKKVKKEMEKCSLLCSNCHSKSHHKSPLQSDF